MGCPAGQVRCLDNSCRASKANCSTLCPVASPIRCPTGECRQKISQCVSKVSTLGQAEANTTTASEVDRFTGIDEGCSATKPVRCFDGSCREDPLKCKIWAGAIKSISPEKVTHTLCGADALLCADGSCKPYIPGQKNLDPCPIIARCKMGTYRCNDGSCLETCTAARLSCTSGEKPCEDGICRKSCLPFDGCPLGAYHCDNRECASGPGDCAAAERRVENGQDLSSTLSRRRRRRLLQVTGAPTSASTSAPTSAPTAPASTAQGSPCYVNCLASVKAQKVTISAAATQTIERTALASTNDLGNVEDVAYLTIPAGAIISNSSSRNELTVLPVADSTMRFAENAVHQSRRVDELPSEDSGATLFYFTSSLSYAQTVLSVAIECVVDKNIITPFPAPLVYEAKVDWTRDFSNEPYKPSDICLAYLFRIKSLSYARWACVTEDRGTREKAGDARNRETSFKVFHRVSAAFTDCGADGQGQIYAFIHSPLEDNEVRYPEPKTWVERNILLLLVILMLIIITIIGCFYAAKRLHRYRKKYHAERDAVDKMQDEVETMEQFGGQAGTKDDAVVMSANPLVTQLKEMQAKVDEQDAKLAEERAQAHTERREFIDQLQTDRDVLAKELEKLQATLQQQASFRGQPQQNVFEYDNVSSPSAAMVGAGPTMAAMPSQPAPTKRQVFNAAPVRKKKNF